MPVKRMFSGRRTSSSSVLRCYGISMFSHVATSLSTAQQGRSEGACGDSLCSEYSSQLRTPGLPSLSIRHWNRNLRDLRTVRPPSLREVCLRESFFDNLNLVFNSFFW